MAITKSKKIGKLNIVKIKRKHIEKQRKLVIKQHLSKVLSKFFKNKKHSKKYKKEDEIKIVNKKKEQENKIINMAQKLKKKTEDSLNNNKKITKK